MTLTTQTTEKTLNKKVKAMIVELFPTAKTISKKHVAGIGYVDYVKDANGVNLAFVYKTTGVGMLIQQKS
jgi:hypothetical protein